MGLPVVNILGLRAKVPLLPITRLDVGRPLDATHRSQALITTSPDNSEQLHSTGEETQA